ncbi:hypothetical protein IFM89_025385 [Coptis chinensis]|uniref:Uncharacterized protein n=1 Tax=Coptis chinensis TaxID=261450 RepID=A0A835LWN0_9MAGN|nr:hypothetical protein IFM89_025385 [Coptis chinensis]
MVEHMAMFPVNTLKIRMQMFGTTSTASSSAHRHNTGKVFTSIMRKEGPLGFYCGIGAIGLGAVVFVFAGAVIGVGGGVGAGAGIGMNASGPKKL